MNVSIHNASNMLSESQIFHIWQPYEFFYIYDHLNIPCLAQIVVFASAYRE